MKKCVVKLNDTNGKGATTVEVVVEKDNLGVILKPLEQVSAVRWTAGRSFWNSMRASCDCCGRHQAGRADPHHRPRRGN